MVEDLVAENRGLQEENQRLRDEINRLKGEQGKPDIKANKPRSLPSTSSDYSSEQEPCYFGSRSLSSNGLSPKYTALGPKGRGRQRAVP